jgi:hypothetical protein
LALLPFMVSTESLWIDEGDTALYAGQTSAAEWVRHLLQDNDAGSEMPLTMWTAWLTKRFVGSSEWALRSQNLFWGIIALVALHYAGKKIAYPWLPLGLAVQPFFWFYMDEARPFAAEVALGAVLLFLVVIHPAPMGKERWWLVTLLTGILVIFATSLLCAVVIGAVLLTLILSNRSELRRIFLENRWIVAVYTVLLSLLSSYYAWKLLKGVSGARIWQVDLKSMLFVFYEIIGCLGLGPSLEVIREHAGKGELTALVPSLALPGLLAAAMVLIIAGFFAGVRSFRIRNDHIGRAILVVCSVVIIMVTASVILHKPLWARHFSPILPFLVLIEVAALHWAFTSGRYLLKVSAIAFLVLLTVSSFQIRFSKKFFKDDYRGASKLALQALGEKKTVWWSAAEHAGLYYRVPLVINGHREGAWVPHRSQFEPNDSALAPDFIITTRPEVYDQQFFVRNYVTRAGYRLIDTPKSFLIYSKE